MKPICALLLSLLLIAIPMPARTQVDPKPDNRFATPEAAANALTRAMFDNDLATAKMFVVYEKPQYEALEIYTHVSQSFKIAIDALLKAFPNQIATLTIGGMNIPLFSKDHDVVLIPHNPMPNILHFGPTEFKPGTAAISGNYAIIPIKDSSLLIYLVRFGDSWKVNFIRTFWLEPEFNWPDKGIRTRRRADVMMIVLRRQTNKIQNHKYFSAESALQSLVADLEISVDQQESPPPPKVAPRPDKRLSTPRSAAKTLYQAMYDNDLRTAKLCVVQGKWVEENLKGTARVMYSMRHATDAARRRFKVGLSTTLWPMDRNDIDQKTLASSTVMISGNRATITSPNGPFYVFLIRTGNVWQVDLLKTLGSDKEMDEPLVREFILTGYNKMADAGERVRFNIQAGKYPNAKAAINSMMQHMENATKGIPDPATRTIER
ncbi:MAG: hypothetical protein ABJA67_13260 [Chthonomonadales bacterium]